MIKNNIWIVTAHRTTLSEHSYVVGLYKDFEDAKKAANIEQYNRGGKYDMDINGYILDKLPEKIINNEI
jgi:hypothetical protein